MQFAKVHTGDLVQFIESVPWKGYATWTGLFIESQWDSHFYLFVVDVSTDVTDLKNRSLFNWGNVCELKVISRLANSI